MSLFNALCIWVIGLCIAWVGDAGHVASGTTTYSPSAWPVVWKSPLWFPLAVGGGLLALAWVGRRMGLPRAVRTRAHLALALPAGIALYLCTSTLHMYAPWVGTSVFGALALLYWWLWDRCWECAVLAAVSAIIVTTAEITLVSRGVYSYAESCRSFFGVPGWLPCFFFALSTIASGLSHALTNKRSRAPYEEPSKKRS